MTSEGEVRPMQHSDSFHTLHLAVSLQGQCQTQLASSARHPVSQQRPSDHHSQTPAEKPFWKWDSQTACDWVESTEAWDNIRLKVVLSHRTSLDTLSHSTSLYPYFPAKWEYSCPVFKVVQKVRELICVFTLSFIYCVIHGRKVAIFLW